MDDRNKQTDTQTVRQGKRTRIAAISYSSDKSLSMQVDDCRETWGTNKGNNWGRQTKREKSTVRQTH